MSEFYDVDYSERTGYGNGALEAFMQGEKVSLYDGERTSQFVVKLGQVATDKAYYEKLSKEQPNLFGSCAWSVAHVGIKSVLVSIHWD